MGKNCGSAHGNTKLAARNDGERFLSLSLLSFSFFLVCMSVCGVSFSKIFGSLVRFFMCAYVRSARCGDVKSK